MIKHRVIGNQTLIWKFNLKQPAKSIQDKALISKIDIAYYFTENIEVPNLYGSSYYTVVKSALTNEINVSNITYDDGKQKTYQQSKGVIENDIAYTTVNKPYEELENNIYISVYKGYGPKISKFYGATCTIYYTQYE